MKYEKTSLCQASSSSGRSWFLRRSVVCHESADLIRVTSAVIPNPKLVRVQVRLDDRSQLVAVAFELLGTHQQVVSEFRHPALTPRGPRERPSDVPMLSTFPRTLPDCRPFRAATLLATLRILDPLSLVRFSTPTVSKLRTRFCLPLVVPVSNFVPWSVSPTRRQCVAPRSYEHGGLVSSRCTVHHGLRLCVLQQRHVPLARKSEVVLEIENGTPARSSHRCHTESGSDTQYDHGQSNPQQIFNQDKSFFFKKIPNVGSLDSVKLVAQMCVILRRNGRNGTQSKWTRSSALTLDARV